MTSKLPSEKIEQSGLALAQLAQQLLDDDLLNRPIVVLTGRGNKGATGLVAARHLLAAGAWVQIVLSHPPEQQQVATLAPLLRIQELEAPLAWAEEGWELPPADLLIDALVGSGLRGDPQGKVRELIQLANSSVAPILSLHAPSGVAIATGRIAMPHILAAATLLADQVSATAVAALPEATQQLFGELYE
jgi:hydroxyethylthiazole kinase-like uncharacterized protein yjeF